MDRQCTCTTTALFQNGSTIVPARHPEHISPYIVQWLHHYPQGTRSTKGDGCTTLTHDYQFDRFIFCACAWSFAQATCCAQLGSIPMEPFKSSNLNGLRRNETTCPHPAKFISEMDCSCQTPLCTNSRTEQPEAQYHNSHRLNIT